MKNYRVVLHFSMPKKLFKKFYEFLINGGGKVDGIYKAINEEHPYYQDYSQILLDFSITSCETLGKKVLFVTSIDQCSEDISEQTLIDKQISNPDIGSLCKRVPIIYAMSSLANKYKVTFHTKYNLYYEAITLLVPSILSQSNKSISAMSLVKAINLLNVNNNFLEGIKEYFRSKKRQNTFSIIETGIF